MAKNEVQKLMVQCDREQKRLDELKQIIQVMPINLLQQAFPEGHWWINTTLYRLEFSLPYSFELIEKFKEFMTMQFPDSKISYDHQVVWHTSGSAGYFIHYKMEKKNSWDYYELEIAFRSDNAGSTCHLNKIGEEMKPVYEVVCSEGAQEEW